MNKRRTISAFVVCHNEESRIERCLDSVKWCDEIVVIDDGSTDNTVELCRKYTDKIFLNPWPGYVLQKRFGLERCSSDWVLNIDADEIVTDGLKEEVLAMLEKDMSSNRATAQSNQEVKVGVSPTAEGSIDGYYIQRTVHYLGKFWRKGGWYPEYRLRLCRRINTSWGGEDPHEKAIVNGRTAKLQSELLHYTHKDVADQVRSINSLSSISALTLYKRKKKPSVTRVIFHPFIRFFKYYIAKRGYREGTSGIFMGIMEGYAVFLKYLKLWELYHKERSQTQR